MRPTALLRPLSACTALRASPSPQRPPSHTARLTATLPCRRLHHPAWSGSRCCSLLHPTPFPARLQSTGMAGGDAHAAAAVAEGLAVRAEGNAAEGTAEGRVKGGTIGEGDATGGAELKRVEGKAKKEGEEKAEEKAEEKGEEKAEEKAEEKGEEDPLVQHVVVRRDLMTVLQWPLGSVITQGCHACVAVMWEHRDHPSVINYCGQLDSMRKVTLEVKGEAQLLNLSKKLQEAGIVHWVWMEQPENIPTCIATLPHLKSVVGPHMRKLKLCK